MDSSLTHGQNAHREREFLTELDSQTRRRRPVGSTLPNGAMVLEAKAGGTYDIVLAFTIESAHPFIVWKVDPDTGDAFWGEYCSTIADGLDAFWERS